MDETRRIRRNMATNVFYDTIVIAVLTVIITLVLKKPLDVRSWPRRLFLFALCNTVARIHFDGIEPLQYSVVGAALFQVTALLFRPDDGFTLLS